MPLLEHIKHKHSHIFVWKYQDDESDFIQDYISQKSHLQVYKGKKKIEKALKEWLIEEYTQAQLAYRANGAPYLLDQNKHISISHAYPMVVLAISDHEIGIDIERKQERFLALKSRFCLEDELLPQEDLLENLCRVWCTKEALYKIDDRKLWSFTLNYRVISPQLAVVDDGQEKRQYHTQKFDFDDFILVVAHLD